MGGGPQDVSPRLMSYRLMARVAARPPTSATATAVPAAARTVETGATPALNPRVASTA